MQRNGLQEEHLECSTTQENIDASLSPRLSFARDPCPDSAKSSLDYVATAPLQEVVKFPDGRIPRMSQLANGALPTRTDRNMLIPAELRHASGKNPISHSMSLLYQHNRGGSDWLSQFLFGFKLAGTLSQKHASPTSEKRHNEKPKCIQMINKSNASRFIGRAPK